MATIPCYTAHDPNPHDPTSFHLAAAAAMRDAGEGGCVCIVVYGESQRTNVADFTGQGRSRFVKDGIEFFVYTLRKLPHNFHGWPVVALWVKENALAEIERRRAGAIYSIPFEAEHNARWVRAKSATDLRTGDTPVAPTIGNPVVAVAMQWIDANAEGVIDPYERSYIVRVFQVLEREGERWDPAEIRAWLVAQGWDAEGADGVEDIARRTWEGSRLKAPHHPPFPPHTIDEWRSASAALTPS